MFVFHGQNRKNLYWNYNCPDDYTDASFLIGLKKNVDVRKVTFSEAFYGACLLSQQLSLVVIFISSFVYLYNDWISSYSMITYTSIVDLVPYIILYRGAYDWLRICRIMLIYAISCLIYAPVFRTLMKTVSTDTIYTLSGMLMCLHLILHDYGVPCLIISTKVSLFLAVFCAVCLISRLTSAIAIFALIHLTVLIFAISPIYLTRIGLSYKLVFFLVSTATLFVYVINPSLSLIFLLVIFFFNVICPYYFVKWHSYKDNIHGPWDEAMLSQKGR